MSWQFTAHLLPLFFVGAISLSQAGYLWRTRRAPGAVSLAGLNAAVAWWALFSSLEIASVDLALKLIWFKLQFIGGLAIPAAWLITVFAYTGRDHLIQGRTLALLAIEPVLILSLVTTNASHNLIWSGARLVEYRDFVGSTQKFGSWGIFNFVYSYLLILFGIYLIQQVLVKSSSAIIREQARSMIFAALIPFLASMSSLAGFNPIFPLNATLVAFGISGGILTWALYRYRLMDILPVARETVIENMSDGVIVLDAQDRVVDLNPAIQSIINRKAFAANEQTGDPILACCYRLLNGLREHGQTHTEIAIGEGSEQRIYEIQVTPLTDHSQRITGYMFVTREMTERKRAEQELNANLVKTEGLYSLSRALISSDSLSAMLHATVNVVADTLPADQVILAIFDLEKKKMLHYLRAGVNAEELSIASFDELTQGLSGWVIRERQPALSTKAEPNPCKSSSPRQEQTSARRGSTIVVPLEYRGRLFGTLTAINPPEADDFTPNDQELVLAMANQAAAAVQNASLFEDAQRRAREADTLRQASGVVAATLNKNEAIERILDQLSLVVPYDSASVQLLGEGYLEIVGGRGWPDPEAVIGIRFPVPGENPNSVVIERGEPYILIDAPEFYSSFQTEPHNHIRSWLGVPMYVHERLIGMLVLDSVHSNYYNDNHAQLIAAFADQVAIAIENARLFSAEKKRAEELDALVQSSAAISASLELPSVFKTTAEQFTRALNATSVYLLNFDPSSGKAEVVIDHFGPEANPLERVSDIGAVYDLNAYPQTLAALRAGQPIISKVSDPQIDLKARDQLMTYKAKSALRVPIMVTGQVKGYVVIWDSRTERDWSSEEIQLSQTLANLSGMAIENARLFDEVQRLAVTDQLTGLYNRRGLFDYGQREIDRANRYHRQLAAILLDIDRFKQINDTYSHAVGDQVLRILADRCQENLRDMDILARYGGEEFAILLPETDIESAQRVAERLREQVAQTPFVTERGPISITISLGLTSTLYETPDIAVLLDRADTAMYAAKQAGRNRVSIEKTTRKITTSRLRRNKTGSLYL